MIIHHGPNALSASRKARLLTEIKEVAPQIKAVEAQFYHFIDISKQLTAKQEEQVDQLLNYDSAFQSSKFKDSLYVLPRFGTISPWSSKATDIFSNAGLSAVNRVERGIRYYLTYDEPLTDKELLALQPLLHDRMIEIVVSQNKEKILEHIFDKTEPASLSTVPIIKEGKKALKEANTALGLALSDDEVEYLVDRFVELERDPTDAELMMFSVANSEHCRHKIFNASWTIDGEEQDESLFAMIRNTHKNNSNGVLSAYSDNGAVLKGEKGSFFFPDRTGEYSTHDEDANIVIKVETHNHPTAIAPHPGAGTGSGGEIRDEGATGRGAKPKAGLTGFMVSGLNIPGHRQPWEKPYGKPDYMASPLQIMLEGPIGGAAFNNEFGRPNVLGFFRSFELSDGEYMRGYHKPLMLAGGLANIRESNVIKGSISDGDKIIVLGGPAMLIGLGGGSASSMNLGSSSEDLDFASVQRQNAEIQRRVQEVINACWSLGKDNPIVSIHDVGAGGISNALPELVHDAGQGAIFELRKVNNDEPGMTPMEIWSNEAQERYVLAISPKDIKQFEEMCERERCPYAVVGEATEEQHLKLTDSYFKNNVVDVSSDLIFGKPPKMERQYRSKSVKRDELDFSEVDLGQAIERVLRHPTVSSKSFLITIGDRTVGGMVAQDQMVGPWQVPVADCAVTINSFDGYSGEAMALGERTPIALIDAAAAGRVAIAEVITNIMGADIQKLSDIRLSANWMAAAGSLNEDQALFETVKAVGMEFCPALDITIPVGKDSMSMRAQWQDSGVDKMVVSPLSLIVTGFTPVKDVRKTITPELRTDISDTRLMLIDLSGGNRRLGGSILAQTYSQLGDQAPDITPEIMQNFFDGIKDLKEQNAILAYHDRSDGGLIATLAEMAFAGRVGLDIKIKGDTLSDLFNEELGAVVQVRDSDTKKVLEHFPAARVVASLNDQQAININNEITEIFSEDRARMQQWWSDVSYKMQRLRDNQECAESQNVQIVAEDPGLSPKVTFELSSTLPSVQKPRVMILREQGVNGHVEMAAAFTRAGFSAIDVHMSDIFSGRVSLDDFVGLAACGGFSYGDVLGAGGGWAKSILVTPKIRKQFEKFFKRKDAFSLGVCNGCQMLAQLKEIIPGAEDWPEFKRNNSEQFEARLTTVKITDSPSIMLKDMVGSLLLVPTAHGEGRVEYVDKKKEPLVAMQYVDNDGDATEFYPFNPNGSDLGETGFTTKDGRVTIMMPHPERVFRNVQFSWKPVDWTDENSPWMKMFQNAYKWTQGNKK